MSDTTHDHTSSDMLRLSAPAKVNLGLEILRRRGDGYHDINTLFLAIDLCDELWLCRRTDDAITLTIEGESGLSNAEDNLCVRAALALRGYVGCHALGLGITLVKRIPIGAGLGGGSSDAAAVLRGAAKLWGITPADHGALRSVAIGLGSDVPFFLSGGLACARSRGEDLWPLGLRIPYTLLLVNPGIHISTAWAYSNVMRRAERTPTDLAASLAMGIANADDLRHRFANDFEEIVFPAHPVLSEIKRRLYDAGALLALLSGSGATLFGLFADHTTATQASSGFSEYWHTTALPMSIG